MRAILIDPFACTITEVEHTGNWRTIAPTLSHETQPVELFDVVRLGLGDGIFVDDEGLMKRPERFFVLASYHDDNGVPVPLAGKGLVIGSNAEGDARDAQVSLDWIKGQVRFYTRVGRCLIRTETPWQPEPNAREANHPAHTTVN
jgi:hypothetical protein